MDNMRSDFVLTTKVERRAVFETAEWGTVEVYIDDNDIAVDQGAKTLYFSPSEARTLVAALLAVLGDGL